MNSLKDRKSKVMKEKTELPDEISQHGHARHSSEGVFEKDSIEVPLQRWNDTLATHSKCTTCGTLRDPTGLHLDAMFWLKVATYAELKNAATFCPWCELLQRTIELCVDVQVESGENVGHLDWSKDPYCPIWYELQDVVPLEVFCTQEIERPPGLLSMPIKSRSEPDVSSDESLRTVSTWIDECDHLHETCRVPSDILKPPTRLLSIGLRGSEHMRLVEPQHLVSWVCLSHRWSDKNPSCTTTRGNYQLQLQDIPWNALPKTFQEAVLLTRRLGYHYIWIDSLCIVQDDVEDWRRESGCMSEYYGAAALTISASGSLNHDDSLLAPPPDIKRTIPQFSLRSNEGLISVRRAKPHPLQAEWENSQVQALPVLSRAWIYQERMLSCRVLHCTSHEFQWECKEVYACQCGSAKVLATNPKIDHARALTPHTETIATTDMLLKRWARVVREYSQLELTFEKDRLPALSGLANQFGWRLKQHEYFAGLWSSKDSTNSLVTCLLWARRRHDSLRARPTLSCCPTWTWASVNGGVAYPWLDRLERRDTIGALGSYDMTGKYSEIFIRSLRPETTLVSTLNITGEVQGGHLRLVGPVVDGVIAYQVSPPQSSNDFTFTTNTAGADLNTLIADYALHLKGNGDSHVADGETVQVLRVCRVRLEPYIVSLVLQKVKNDALLLERNEVYGRIGIVEEAAPRNYDYLKDIREITIL